ncbi:hypothetical protein NUW58_g2925 [Xylaria curta]|uniref:Uncharacterized protein n=1 Tax=Xylaria curta TaxID=42375 RepID=A0ACC1PDA3_9PEZI|nr:hypothetical protein NUW58_g2925 [Xylaria curta]
MVDIIELNVTHPSPEAIESTRAVNNERTLHDDDLLIRLGKRPLLDRSFGFMSSIGLSSSVMLSWESALFTLTSTLVQVGAGGVVWAFLIGWVGITSVYTVIAELSSMAPTAGGQYHWVALLAPRSCANFLSYLTAWLTTLAWQALSTTTSFAVATLIQGIVVLVRPSYTALPWHTVLIMLAVALLSVLVNSTTGRVLAALERLFLLLHLAGFLGIVVPLVYFSPHNSASEVFMTFYNKGFWPTQAVAFLVGLPPVASTLVGGDCAVHMSEEVRSANVVVPRSLLYTTFINGSLGFSMILALLFCATDVEAAVRSADRLYPFLHIFYTALESTTGACLLAGIVLVVGIASSISIYATSSRMIWSFARDNGLPFNRTLVKLNRNALPVYAILATMGITTLLSLIVLGSSVVLSALLSLSIAAIYSSYLIACALLLWRRVKGGIMPYHEEQDRIGADTLIWGPWKVSEPFGTLNNAFACLYMTFLLFWSFWPEVNYPTPAEVNWSILVIYDDTLGTNNTRPLYWTEDYSLAFQLSSLQRSTIIRVAIDASSSTQTTASLMLHILIMESVLQRAADGVMVTETNKNPILQATIWLLLALSSLILIFWLVTKFYIKTQTLFVLGDSLMLASYVCIPTQVYNLWLTISLKLFALGESIALIVPNSTAFGRDMAELSEEQLSDSAKIGYARDILFVLSIGFSKLSTCESVHALSPDKAHHRWAYLLALSVIIWMITAIFGTAFQCGARGPWSSDRAACINLVSGTLLQEAKNPKG